MIQGYKNISIIYGGTGREYAQALNRKIYDISNNERFPIRSTIINERILTRELLQDVMTLFKESEFCVAFLTKDDCCLIEQSKKMRIRQNVVFELGMALIELGRERCIILSDFDVKDSVFDLPSDMNSLKILNFSPLELDKVLDAVIDKLLRLSMQSKVSGYTMDDIPKYHYLLTRVDYHIDYENIFNEHPLSFSYEGQDFFNDTLFYWTSECKRLPHFDEKCIYLLERIGFVPIFGRQPSVINFLEQAEKLVENYRQNDILYYGDSILLDFTQNLIQCIIEYTKLKLKDTNSQSRFRKYKFLLQNFLSDNAPSSSSINPLLLVAYYDYLGLTYLRIYTTEKNEDDLRKAKEAFEKSLKYVSLVDMSMHIWSGFLTYNLARVFSECNDPVNSEKYFKKSIKIRSKWLRMSNFNVTVRNSLSYEYFLAKISYLDMCEKFRLMSQEEVQNEYSYVEKELNTYSDVDSHLDQLVYIRKLLKDRKNK